jgi:hypothetical protein
MLYQRRQSAVSRTLMTMQWVTISLRTMGKDGGFPWKRADTSTGAEGECHDERWLLHWFPPCLMRKDYPLGVDHGGDLRVRRHPRTLLAPTTRIHDFVPYVCEQGYSH